VGLLESNGCILDIAIYLCKVCACASEVKVCVAMAQNDPSLMKEREIREKKERE